MNWVSTIGKPTSFSRFLLALPVCILMIQSEQALSATSNDQDTFRWEGKSIATVSQDFKKTLSRPFPYKASNLSVERIIGDFSRKMGLPVRVHGSMLKRIDIDNIRGTVEEFLGSLSSRSEIAWWYDGAAYHFELNSEVTSDVVETRGYPVDRLTERIRELGIVNRPFPFRQSADGALLYVAGPKKYVETTSDLARRLVALRMRRGTGEDVQILPRIYVGGPNIEQRKEK